MKAQHKHHYETRFHQNFQYPRHRLTLVQKNPQYMGKTLYNKLPNILKDIMKENSFKHKLKRFLMEKMYYSVDEFLND